MKLAPAPVKEGKKVVKKAAKKVVKKATKPATKKVANKFVKEALKVAKKPTEPRTWTGHGFGYDAHGSRDKERVSFGCGSVQISKTSLRELLADMEKLEAIHNSVNEKIAEASGKHNIYDAYYQAFNYGHYSVSLFGRINELRSVLGIKMK